MNRRVNMRLLKIGSIGPLFLLALAMPPLATSAAPADATKAMRQDAAVYSERFNVSAAKAIENLRLQREAGELSARLREREAGIFAGLWIEHGPPFRVIVRFTRDVGLAHVNRHLPSSALEGLIDIRSAEWPLTELQERQSLVRELLLQFGIRADSELDVRANRVNVYALDPAEIEAAFANAGVALPQGVVLKQVPALAQPEPPRGGSALSTCTAGFTVRNNGDDELGILTAGHCGSSQSYEGTDLPFRADDESGSQDVQWHSTCDIFDTSNEFRSGIGVRDVTATRSRSNQAIGAMVCKYGMTTGRTCGDIYSKSFAPSYINNANDTFIHVSATSQYPDLSDAGDSGSPWFVEQTAYGIHSGGFISGSFEGDAIYMAINYISSLGVSVLTSDPGECNLRPDASFTWSNPAGTFVEFDASASFDPDGSIVEYQWDFGDGTTTTTTDPTTSHSYADGGTYFVLLTVIDNEGKSGFASDSVTLSCDGDDNLRICPE